MQVALLQVGENISTTFTENEMILAAMMAVLLVEIRQKECNQGLMQTTRGQLGPHEGYEEMHITTKDSRELDGATELWSW